MSYRILSSCSILINLCEFYSQMIGQTCVSLTMANQLLFVIESL